jgi:hypothetical protein
MPNIGRKLFPGTTPVKNAIQTVTLVAKEMVWHSVTPVMEPDT